VKLLKYVSYVVGQIVAFSAGSLMEIKKPVPAKQARFPQFRVIERFCVAGISKHSDHAALYSKELEKFY